MKCIVADLEKQNDVEWNATAFAPLQSLCPRKILDALSNALFAYYDDT